MSDEGSGPVSGLLIGLISLIAFVVVFIIIPVSMQKGIFWLDTQNAKHQVQINNINAHGTQHGYAAQEGALADLNNNMTAIEGMSGVTDQGQIDQRLAFANKVCADATQIFTVSMGSSDRQWVRQHCAGPAVKPGDSLRKGA